MKVKYELMTLTGFPYILQRVVDVYMHNPDLQFSRYTVDCRNAPAIKY